MATPLFPDTDLHGLPALPAEAVEHGEVFTRRWVVDLILDLLGYTADKDLCDVKLVEPACGSGAFLVAVASRISASCRAHNRPITDALAAVRALDLLERNVKQSRAVIEKQLVDEGWQAEEAQRVAAAWVEEGDYLLQSDADHRADYVVGNPPYIRLEDVPDHRMAAYRSACPTMGGRADIYVGFYEIALQSLKPGGQLGFICADRWMRNQYGSRLRQLVKRRFSMDLALVMHDVDAFDDQVSAYPAITIISNRSQGEAVAADTTRAFGDTQAHDFADWYTKGTSESITTPAFQAARMPHWFPDEDSWPAASPARLAVLEELTERFRLLEDDKTGTRVGIGIATGADKVFLTDDDTLVERDRLLPMAMVRDTTSGTLNWHGTYLVNPWTAEGDLVDLTARPRLFKYFEEHGAALRKRYIAVKQPERWYKTIDKVDHRLTGRPKLLFPDMKLTSHPVLDEGGLYPHHNLYFIVSDVWDMRVLGGLLLSKVAEAFVEAYAVKMRGGTLRFQAQYLRKIRVPDPAAISESDRVALAEAFDKRDVKAATEAALRVYGLAELPD
ncbi:Eco57I restriction-modification methylase domain-containing protein [Streptomyces olivaceus]|uniref:site-specific DNA-methyltransferase (adenine-specific) n=1 Tax=Streptomyces olivaceus TaxID=47716 RepID=A0ABS7WG02_STROV|nr:Eco57I restriction-modification methylase domain-containing protein [Streptomyces olivaceus]MBZ6093297.1 Eco57I restriction-modification methylase domain-containing protein [Streptomyces olivaceus]MBZ6100316.1 Eco57I restriction-modification methylase domain-containing protein [Streptomyces olivaceus]MBZ6121480.1 Eco57I restriction-modification methylase domain-containing protein [Streptomyces olivaceus]MBZ6156130.1 Eco57I restriction-modification methylase domain-containing protein [Strepto